MTTTLRAITLLTPHLRDIAEAWHKRLKVVARGDRNFDALKGLKPESQFRAVRRGGILAFRRMLLRQGQRLAALDVPLEDVIAAYREFLRLSLRRFPRRDTSTRAVALALVRLNFVGQLYLISGYTSQRKEQLKRLEQSLGEAEEHLQGLSTIITNVYDRERRRISRDLHDDVGHDLIVLKLYLEMLCRDVVDGKTARLRRRLDEAIALVATAIERVRQLAFDLGPAISHELGFVSAIRMYVREFVKRTGIRVTVRASRFSRTVPSTHEMTLYRVLQGALSNVARHAKAGRATVTLATLRDAVVMKIQDDGVGFDVSRALEQRQKSFGLVAMQERAEMVGGRLTLKSQKDGRHGTIVELLLPLPSEI